MSHDFKPGDKVVCVNGAHAEAWGIIQGNVYTIERAGIGATGNWMVDLVEVFKGNPPHPPLGWNAKRFELVLDEDRAAGMVPMSGTVKPEPVMEPVAFALPCGRSQAIDVSPTTYPASAFPATAFRERMKGG